QIRIRRRGQRADNHNKGQAQQNWAKIGAGHLQNQTIDISLKRFDTNIEGDDPEPSHADNWGAITYRCGNKGWFDQILTNSKQTLGDGLVADSISQNCRNIGRTLIHKCSRREEALLPGAHMPGSNTGFKDTGTTGGEEHNRNNNGGCSKHRHKLTETGKHRGAKTRPQPIQKHTSGDHDNDGSEAEESQDGKQSTTVNKIRSQRDGGTQHIGPG